jgi:3-hydroxybutyryl-CoA dehydrogenase
MTKLSDEAVHTATPIGVVGAGTMGRGIARVAAGAGHPVLLTDANPDVADAAIEELRSRLDRDVARGRITASESTAIPGRITTVESIGAMADVGLVIEAVAEDLDVKHTVFRELAGVVDPNAILATNTSSLSVDAIAAAIEGPHRVVGMHFFNPAPLLPLVEIVAGRATDPAVVNSVRKTATAWGKVPVVCTDTPGFIVNRIARPFYLEALAMLEQDEAEPSQLDAVFRGAGFRMGPFELLDLIGIDINLAVSESVHRQLGDDPRIPPSALQRTMVTAGELGRKTGAGFYTYPAGPPRPVRYEPIAVQRIEAIGALGHGTGLVDRLASTTDVEILPADDGPGRLVIDGHVITPAPHATRPGATLDLVSDWSQTTTVGAAGTDTALAALAGACAVVGIDVAPLDDTPGLGVMRTVAMIVTIATEAVDAGVATRQDIDTAMRLGVNHPLGPSEWLDLVGQDAVDTTLRQLSARSGGERYRPVRT